MSIHRIFIRLTVAFGLSLAALFTTSVFGQSVATPPGVTAKDVVAVQGSPSSTPETKVAVDEPKADDLKSEIETVKAENAIVREQVRLLMEQQRKILDQVSNLQRKLDNKTEADPQAANAPAQGLPAAAARPGDPADPGVGSVQDAPSKPGAERYQDGIVYQGGDNTKIPFLVRFNVNTQVRYINTLSSDDTYIDHLGVVREVKKRNDITLNRAMFILSGYVFDKRLQYGLMVWTSAGASSVVIAGSVGWRFNKAVTLSAGYVGIPGARSLTNTFPFFAAIDRSMADNFFRPGFTQGVWASGEPIKNLNYIAFVGNSLNTLSVSASKIDTDLMYSGSVWWEPLGSYSEPGKSRHMYDDYFATKKTRIRIGTSFTRSREDRFSNLDQSSPDNTALFNSDGVNTFATGAFALGVTVDKALYKMWAIDGGLKYNGFSVNGQYYMRWLSDFEADGPIPLTSTFDHGFELTAGKFVVPKKLQLYGRGSAIYGQFGNSSEYGGGARWYFLPTERLWLNAELVKMNKTPYNGAFSPYFSGVNGWVPMIQTILAF